MLSDRGWRGRIAASALVVAGCGLAHSENDVTYGGESHFLRYCGDGCGPGLECIGGVCTRACQAATCHDLSPGAICVAPRASDDRSSCDVACETSADCAALSSEHSCRSGFCRAPALGASGTTGAGGNAELEPTGALSSSEDATEPPAMPPGAACRVALRDYPSGSADIPAPSGCGSCTCMDGVLDCIAQDCPLGTPMIPCTSELSDAWMAEGGPFGELLASDISGDTLTLRLRYAGGCARHDFSLCGGEITLQPNPPIGIAIFMHDAHGDTCTDTIEETLRFDLRRVARVNPGATLVQLEIWGLPDFGGDLAYQAGPLNCSDRSYLISQDIGHARDAADHSCQTAADCVLHPSTLSCTDCFVNPLSATGAMQLDAALSAIEAKHCPAFTRAGCVPYPCEPYEYPIDCIEGRCEAAP